METDAPLFIASSANLLPSILLPLIAKKILFFLTFLELIIALLIITLSFNFLPKVSSTIFVFQFWFNFLFFSLIDFIMQSLSEKYLFLLYS